MGGVIGRRNTFDSDKLDNRASTSIENINEFGENETNTRRGKKRRKTSNTKVDYEAKMFKLDTPKYVYKKLFLEGSKSDVVINAFGHKWHLHRVYLEQCDYFRVLFNGNWNDSYKREYSLNIADENICYSGFYLFKY